ETFLSYFNNTTIFGLLLTLILIFSFQGDRIIEHTLHIALISIPLILQTGVIFFLTYGVAKKLRLPHDIAAPASLIGASNFFELAVAVAIALFGLASPVALVTIVGVLVEVPVMILLVRYANKTRSLFE
ncbi:MAG TPA: arsenical-resistance protein, partial [Verrucomicrobia bacterium]|nr:arsenical-resistance protein [Verrucomicrobiota bacterium]